MGLNEYTKYNRTNKYAGAEAKKKEQQYIITWIEENKRRDLDNICFAKKFILDALVEAGVLQDDNRKIVTNFTDSFEYSNSSKVIVELEELNNGF